MSDTIQVVQWALGQHCPLRQGADWEKPGVAIKTLSDCRTYSRLRQRQGRGFGIFGDVCVTSVTSALPGEISRYDYPCDGFVLSSQFSPVGGLPSLLRLCGDCPANGNQGDIAGCVGSFYQALYSKELQEQLDRLIDRLGHATKLDSLFPQTSLHWFRFWLHSPIPAEGVVLLHELLEAVYEEDELEFQSSGQRDFRGQHADLRAFIEALARSMQATIPMHVNLTPPGHTDFGWHTIFSHCPTCKAEAPVARWKRKYLDEEIECAMCGANYSPAKTHSAERYDWDRKELRDILGQAEFEKFASRCLVAQGASETEAAQIVQKHEDRERVGKEKRAQLAEACQQHQQFVEQVIFKELKNLSPRDENFADWLFSLHDTEEILRRCEHHGGKVLHISHISESGDYDEFLEVTSRTPATDALQKLCEKGCSERFYVTMKFPKEVIERWKQQQPE